MSIIGLGIDLIDLKAFSSFIEDQETDFIARCFTIAEQSDAEDSPDRLQYLAGRFAAKEAIAKALGTGFNGEVAPQEIEIRSRSSGAPKIILSGEASQTAVNLGITDWKLSISHTDSAVIASAIALEARYSGGSRTPCAT